MAEPLILAFSCADRPGIVARVTGYLAQMGANITEAQQFDDLEQGRFFMRVAFDPGATDREDIREGFGPIAHEYGMAWSMQRRDRPRRVLLLVSKFDHCLADLLYRHRIGEIAMEIVGVVSNHPREAINTLMLGDIPFHHLPMAKGEKAAQEAQIRAIVDETRAELVVLARYMQILSDEMAGFLSGRCINIHHSFLPSFKGAKPYHQAFERGVKIIGATAHYVTTDLDEGPIIEQGVHRVDHTHQPEDLVEIGRDVECTVLARAVNLHVEHRVLLNGGKTVVFS
jgi:formyltetrahydrofolate deformylase